MSFTLQAKYSPCADQIEAIKSLCSGFTKGKKQFQTLLGVTGSGKTFTMANVIKTLGKKTLLLAPNKTLAAQLYAEFKEFFPQNRVEYFVSYYDYYRPEAYKASTDTYIEKDSAVNDDIDKLRHSATRSLLESQDVIVIASISCIYGLGSPEEYEQLSLDLFTNTEYEMETIIDSLCLLQYTRNEVEFTRGKFRVRGDVIEIFPAYEDSVIAKLEFFDELLEKITLVDPLTNTKLKEIQKLRLYPASHYAVSKQVMTKALKNIRVELQERLQYFESENKLVEKQRLESRCLNDIEMMEEMGFCAGIENYSRHFTNLKPKEPPYTLLDFFKKDFLLIIDESHVAIPQIVGMYKGDQARKKSLVDYGFRLPCALDNRPLKFEEFWTKIDQVLFVSATPGEYELERSQGEIVEQLIRPTYLLDPIIEQKSSENQVEDLCIESLKVIKNNHRVLVTTLTKKLAQELTDYFISKGIKAQYLHSDIDTLERMKILKDLRSGVFDVLVGINLLREGLDLPEVALVGITDADQEGFLRSSSALIQTIGRAARNEAGRVILYGRSTTKAMAKALEETTRRRAIQENYNTIHQITPKTVQSDIKLGIMEILKGKKNSKNSGKSTSSIHQVKEIEKEIEALKKQMKSLAKNLEFEKAAIIRDKVNDLKKLLLV